MTTKNDKKPAESVLVADDPAPGQPTEADYEKARTEGIADEPELPPGKFRG